LPSYGIWFNIATTQARDPLIAGPKGEPP